MSSGPTDEQRRRIRRTSIVLGLTALAIYATFIVSGMLRAPS